MIVTPTGRVVVFGATGFTGELLVRSLLNRDIEPIVAGRRPAALERLVEKVGRLEMRVADASNPRSVRALVDRGDVLISAVGPFSQYGRVAVEAALEAGAHYLDPAGEGRFVRSVLYEYGPRAEQNGVALLPAFGFESVPGNLAATVALRSATEKATSLEVLYVCDPRVSSGGTRASAADVMIERGFAWQNGRLVDRRVGAKSRKFEIGKRRVLGLSIPSSEHLVLPSGHPDLRDIEVYLGGFGPLARPLQLSAAVGTACGRVPALRRMIGAINGLAFRPSTGGPSERVRAKTTTYAHASVSRHGRELSQATFAGPDPYAYTADVLAWAADNILAGRLRRAGGLGPSAAFGDLTLIDSAEDMGFRDITRRQPA